MQGLDAYYDGLLAEHQRKLDEAADREEEADRAEQETQGEEDDDAL
jgi:hypothetical protein